MKTDSQIQKDVMEELSWEPSIEITDIGVAVHGGIVTLSGNVDTYFKKLSAEKAALRVKDVKGVACDIEVRLGTESRRNDTEIAAAAVAALNWNSVVPTDKVQVRVDNGWLTLEGEVRWQYQKNAAEDAVKHLTGVRAVTNLIKLNPATNTVLVRDNIRRALERSADVEAAGIQVETSGSKVTLKGRVNSWNERFAVEQAAWSSPGVTVVEDDLIIGP